MFIPAVQLSSCYPSESDQLFQRHHFASLLNLLPSGHPQTASAASQPKNIIVQRLKLQKYNPFIGQQVAVFSFRDSKVGVFPLIVVVNNSRVCAQEGTCNTKYTFALKCGVVTLNPCNVCE